MSDSIRYLATYSAQWMVGGSVSGNDEFIAGRILNAVALAAYRANWSQYCCLQHEERMARMSYSVGIPSSSERLVCTLVVNDVVLRVAATSKFFVVRDGWDDGLPSIFKPSPITALCRDIEDNLHQSLLAVQSYGRL